MNEKAEYAAPFVIISSLCKQCVFATLCNFWNWRQKKYAEDMSSSWWAYKNVTTSWGWHIRFFVLKIHHAIQTRSAWRSESFCYAQTKHWKRALIPVVMMAHLLIHTRLAQKPHRTEPICSELKIFFLRMRITKVEAKTECRQFTLTSESPPKTHSILVGLCM